MQAVKLTAVETTVAFAGSQGGWKVGTKTDQVECLPRADLKAKLQDVLLAVALAALTAVLMAR